jgi:hypothetical protein
VRGGSCGGVTVMTPKCARCDDTFWVCERHDDMPSDCGPSPRACKCGAPGVPSPDCNPCGGPDEPPKDAARLCGHGGRQGAAKLINATRVGRRAANRSLGSQLPITSAE